MTGRIILLRHGQTTSNVTHKLDTKVPGAELTEQGREQAYQAGLELAEYCGVHRGSMGRIQSIVSSVALRAQQTAMIAASAIEEVSGLGHRSAGVDVRWGIHELQAGVYEMLNDHDAHRAYGEVTYQWFHGDREATIPDGENLDGILGRYQPVLEELAEAHPDGDAIVVSHGGIIRVAATHATGTDAHYAMESYIPNCRFITLVPNGKPFGQWELERWADYDLPGDLPGA